MKVASLIAVGLIALATTPALAAEKKHAGHQMTAMKPIGPGADTPAAEGYMKAMDAMNGAMSKMQHHQAAIDMAKVQLKYGKDSAMRRLAEDIVAAQQKEIAEMNLWLAKHPGQ